MNKGGLYFHIPFCLKKCAYCDFCSFVGVNEEGKKRYVDALIAEMESYAFRARDLVFDTLFFGGGTPTLLCAEDFSRILSAAHRFFRIEKGAEITAEANPASADGEKLKVMRSLGINRLSIGFQTLSDSELAILGRVHTAEDALRFYDDAEKAGFSDINVDLMYGVPYQTVSSFAETLKGVLRLSPTHISAYSLMLEEGTPLYEKRKALSFPTEEEEEAIDLLLKQTLSAHGYLHYEISNYAREGYVCRHNLHYWHSDSYLGFGVAAHSYFAGERYGNSNDINAYLAAPTVRRSEKEYIDREALEKEWLMLRFRLAEGISFAEYRKAFGIRLEKRYALLIEKYENMGLMRKSDTHLALTEKGMRLSNAIIVDFLG